MTKEEALRRFCVAVLEQDNLSEMGIDDIKGDLWPDGFRVVFKVPYSAMEVDIEDRAEVLATLLGEENDNDDSNGNPDEDRGITGDEDGND